MRGMFISLRTEKLKYPPWVTQLLRVRSEIPAELFSPENEGLTTDYTIMQSYKPTVVGWE